MSARIVTLGLPDLEILGTGFKVYTDVAQQEYERGCVDEDSYKYTLQQMSALVDTLQDKTLWGKPIALPCEQVQLCVWSLKCLIDKGMEQFGYRRYEDDQAFFGLLLRIRDTVDRLTVEAEHVEDCLPEVS